MDTGMMLFALLAFLAVVLLLEGLFAWWSETRGPQARALRRRLQAIAGEIDAATTASLAKKRREAEDSTFERIVLALPRVLRLERMLRQSGLDLTAGRLLGLCAAAAAATCLVLLVVDAPAAIALAGAAGAGLVPVLYAWRARARRHAALERQLPDAIDMISRSLRAGHAFPVSLQMVGQEMAEPTGTEFKQVFDEVSYGVPLQDALLGLATRHDSEDMRFFVIAVLLQRETGGNLAEILDNLSRLVRERFKLLGSIRVLTAEGRLSAWVLTALPFGTAGLMFLIAPEFMSTLWTDPKGQALTAYSLALMVFGIFWMWRLVKIRV